MLEAPGNHGVLLLQCQQGRPWEPCPACSSPGLQRCLKARMCFHSAGSIPGLAPPAPVVGTKSWGRPQAPLSSREKLQKGEPSAYSHSTRRSMAVVKHQL